MRIDLPMIEFFGRGGALKPSWYGDCLPSRDFPMLVDLYLDGRLDLDRFVSETIGIERRRGRLRPHAARRGAALGRRRLALSSGVRAIGAQRFCFALPPLPSFAASACFFASDLAARLERARASCSRARRRRTASRAHDAPPGLVALLVRDALDLVEPCDGVADVTGVGQRFLALLRERELLVRQPVLLGRCSSRRLLLLGRRHLHLLASVDRAPRPPEEQRS